MVKAATYFELFIRYVIQNSLTQVSILCMLLLGSIGFQLLEPYILGHFVEAAKLGENAAPLVQIGLAFCAIAIGQQLLGVSSAYVAGVVGWNATNTLRKDLLAHCLSLDLEFHTNKTSGELIERIDGDAAILNNFLSRFAFELVTNLLLIIAILALLIKVDWRTGLVMTVFTALALFVLLCIRAVAGRIWLALRDVTGRFYGYIGEALAAREDLRANGAVTYAFSRFWALMREWWPRQRMAMMAHAVTFIGPVVIFALGDALAFFLIFHLYKGGEFSLSTAYSVFFFIVLLGRPVEAVRGQLQQLQRADAGVQRVRTLLAERPTVVGGSKSHLPSGALGVEFNNVGFAYGTEPVLFGVRFTLEPGRVLGLLGHTGSGKSTLARLLVRFFDPVGGEVRVGGVSLPELPLPELRSRVGMVTQEVQLFSASLRDNLTFFNPEVTDERLWMALAELGLDGWARTLPAGLDGQVDPTALSAGEAQLLAFTRLLLRDPGLVVLDEASSRMDRATEGLLERALDRLLQGRTAIIIAHRLGTVRRADDILVLEGGRVAEWGPRAELAARPDSRFAHLLRVGLEEAPS